MAGPGDDERELVTLERAEVVRIMREGNKAGQREGAKPTECPYSPNGDANERVRVQAWLRGFLQARST